MKQRVGELNGKSIVKSDYEDDVTYNEILLEDTATGIVLKLRNTDGILVSMTDAISTPIVQIVDTYDVFILMKSSISGPSKWVRGSDYLFYINKKEEFTIVDNATSEDITDKATLVATGTANKVYKINSKYCTSITIEEIL